MLKCFPIFFLFGCMLRCSTHVLLSGFYKECTRLETLLSFNLDPVAIQIVCLFTTNLLPHNSFVLKNSSGKKKKKPIKLPFLGASPS